MTPSALTLQYLHWALAAAHRADDPKVVRVVLVIDPVRGVTTTRTVSEDEAAGRLDHDMLYRALLGAVVDLSGPVRKFDRKTTLERLRAALRAYDGTTPPRPKDRPKARAKMRPKKKKAGRK